MNFFARLRAAWFYLRVMPYDSAVDHEDYWTLQDRAEYSAFINSPTGQKLTAIAHRLITRSAVNATNASTDLALHCGFARGFTAAFSWMDTLLPPPKPEKQEQGDTEESVLGAFDQ